MFAFNSTAGHRPPGLDQGIMRRVCRGAQATPPSPALLHAHTHYGSKTMTIVSVESKMVTVP